MIPRTLDRRIYDGLNPPGTSKKVHEIIKEKIHFLEIANGSLTQTFCQLDLAHDLGYITDTEFINETKRINVIGKQLSGLRTPFQRRWEESANP